MSAAEKWTREGPKSGPANVLNGRWEIRRGAGSWGIWDRRFRMWAHVDPRAYKTMREARAAASDLARRWPV